MPHPLNAVSRPFETTQIALQAQQELVERNRYMVKLAMAALIVNDAGEVLVAAHEGRDGEFEQGALGAAMETYRYVPSRTPTTTETPLEVFRRCLLEELLDECPEKYNAAGLFLDWHQPVKLAEWSAGPHKNYTDIFGVVTSLVVRVSSPEVLQVAHRSSKEILHAEFRSIPSILASKQPKRPGYDAWLSGMQQVLAARTTTVPVALQWRKGPEVDRDVRFPFSGSTGSTAA